MSMHNSFGMFRQIIYFFHFFEFEHTMRDHLKFTSFLTIPLCIYFSAMRLEAVRLWSLKDLKGLLIASSKVEWKYLHWYQIGIFQLLSTCEKTRRASNTILTCGTLKKVCFTVILLGSICRICANLKKCFISKFFWMKRLLIYHW